MSKLINTTLGDLVEFQRGYDLPKSNFKDGNIPVISSNGILGFHNKFKVKGPGVTIGRSGTVGLPHYIQENFFPHNTALYVKDFKGNDPKYIFYLLKTLGLNQRKSGSGVPTMNRNHLHPLKISAFLDFLTQSRIASVLSALDAKIELNNRINTELEAMAKTLYDYWFVQFDFPFPSTGSGGGKNDGTLSEPARRSGGAEGYKTSGGKMVWNEELKREVPEGWGINKLNDIANITTGKLDSNQVVEDGKYPFFTCAPEPLKIDTFAFDDKVILIAGNNAGGNFHINRYKGKFNAYQRTYVLTAKSDFYYEYLYFVLEGEMKRLKSSGQGSQTKFLTMPILNSITLFKSSNDTIERFHKIGNPIFEKQALIFEENQQLSSLRDWLLPMLMNGQVRVKGDCGTIAK